ncbi:hypothetical protein HY524_00160 [Candidatus Berkelbacteria bacterium]|nr:hypothetical protein [Candidatus Berkelbacteria bacterium]
MAMVYFCAECNYETEERSCPMCNERTEQLNIKDDPLFGTPTKDVIYTHGGEEEVY